MIHWCTSSYSCSLQCDTGELILYNSYMGAIARIPVYQSEKILRILEQGEFDDESRLDDPMLKELCTGGFFVPSHVREREMVNEVLERERNSVFSVIVLPHENCNFRCVYCYEKFERGAMAPGVVTGLKSLVDRKAAEYKRVSVCWFGGEPLLAKEIVADLSESFIRSCQKAGVPYTSSMTTNGYLLNAELIDSLLHSEIRNFQITLDGPEASHDSTRKLGNGRGTYKKILENLKALQRNNGDFRVKIRVNYNLVNSLELTRWVQKEIVPLFGGDPRFSMSFHSVGRWGGVNDSLLEICDAKAAARIRKDLTVTSVSAGMSDKTVKEFLRPHGNVCYAAKESSIVVGADGTLYKCTVAFDDVRNHVGVLAESGEMQLDKERWSKWVTIDEKIEDQCASCLFYPPCQGRKCPLTVMNDRQACCPMTISEWEAMVKAVAFAPCT